MIFILLAFAALFLHNAWFYSPHSGYDAGIHMIYTRIITGDGRIPLPIDTPESYNPPLFYWLSGQLAKVFTPLFNNNFLDALKTWQILIAFLLMAAGYLWYDIFKILNFKNKRWGWFFLIWLLSLPVVAKMAPMYNLETPQLILSTIVVWYFVKFFISRPSVPRAVILGLLGGAAMSLRAMSASLLLSLGLGIIVMALMKKINWKKMIIFNLIFPLSSLFIGGQYYWFYRDKGVFDTGENVAENRKIPFFQRQPKTFYTDTFFRTMMRTPIRSHFPNRFIPIFYSSFWGDYWNYYRQRRFPLTAEQEKHFPSNKEKISPERLKVLAWQNRINLIPTVIIIIGMLAGTVRVFTSRRNLAETFLVIFFWTTWLLFIYTNIEFPNLYKGDTIKASYILYAVPVLIYFAVKFLAEIKRRPVLYPLAAAVIVSWLFNLHFDYF